MDMIEMDWLKDTLVYVNILLGQYRGTVMSPSNMYLYTLAFSYANMILNFSMHKTVEGFRKSSYRV